MNFPNDDSTQTGIINVSYTTPYSSITNPNILLNDFKSGIYNPSLDTIKFFTKPMHLQLILINVYMGMEPD
jgi:hypothetical protein